MCVCVCVCVCVFVCVTGRGRQAPVHGSRETATPGGRDEREDEIRKLRNALGTEKNRNKQLITVIEKKVLDYQKSNRYHVIIMMVPL